MIPSIAQLMPHDQFLQYTRKSAYNGYNVREVAIKSSFSREEARIIVPKSIQVGQVVEKQRVDSCGTVDSSISLGMDHSDTFSESDQKPKQRLSKNQVHFLESEFAKNQKPDTRTKKLYARRLDISYQSVLYWYQNKRAHLKRLQRDLEWQRNIALKRARSVASVVY